MLTLRLCLLLLVSPLAFSQSIEQITQRANDKDPRAQFELAERYRIGNGVARSDTDALYWYEQSAVNGSKRGAYQLAQYHLNGFAPNPSPETALFWLTKLALEGDSSAKFALGAALETLSDSPEPEQLAKIWYRLASPNNTDAELAYERLLEQEFNNRKAKQLASFDEFEAQANQPIIQQTTEFVPTQPQQHNAVNLNWLYLSIAVAGLFAVTTLHFLFRANRFKQSINELERKSLKPVKASKGDERNQMLEKQLQDQNQVISKQKKQLETLFRQFKKVQSQNGTPSKPVAKPDQKVALACALLGFTENNLPNEKTLKLRFKQLSKIYHPDTYGSEEEMKRLNAAVKTLVPLIKRN